MRIAGVFVLLVVAVTAIGCVAQTEYDALENRYDALEQRHDSLLGQNEALTADLEKAHQRIEEMEARIEARNSELQAAQGTLADLQSDLADLRYEAGRLQELQEEKEHLIAEVEAIESDRQALVPRTTSIPILCTGSMNPTITCLDKITLLTNPRPEDIGVGAVIAFDMPRGGCGFGYYTADLILHRVLQIKGEGKSLQVKTRGDNNPHEDSCWVTFSLIHSYVVDIEKSTNLQGKALLKKIWALEEQSERQGAELDRMDREIELNRSACQAWCSNSFLYEANEQVDLYNAKVEQYNALLDRIDRLRVDLAQYK